MVRATGGHVPCKVLEIRGDMLVETGHGPVVVPLTSPHWEAVKPRIETTRETDETSVSRVSSEPVSGGVE